MSVAFPFSQGNDVAGPLLEKYLKGKKGVTVENRRRILRLIENMTMGRSLQLQQDAFEKSNNLETLVFQTQKPSIRQECCRLS